MLQRTVEGEDINPNGKFCRKCLVPSELRHEISIDGSVEFYHHRNGEVIFQNDELIKIHQDENLQRKKHMSPAEHVHLMDDIGSHPNQQVRV